MPGILISAAHICFLLFPFPIPRLSAGKRLKRRVNLRQKKLPAGLCCPESL